MRLWLLLLFVSACGSDSAECSGQLVEVDENTYCVHDLSADPGASCLGTDHRFPASQGGVLVCAKTKLAGDERDRVFSEVRFLFDDCPNGFELAFGASTGCVLPYPEGQVFCSDGTSPQGVGAVVVCTAATVSNEQVVDALVQHCADHATSQQACDDAAICAHIPAANFMTYSDGACMPAQSGRCLLLPQNSGDDATTCAFSGDSGFWWRDTSPPHGYEASPDFDGALVCDCFEP